MRVIRPHPHRGGVAVITLLFVTGAALTVALTANFSAVASFRAARDRHLSDRAYAAAESGAADAARRLRREQGLTSLADLPVDGVAVSRAATTSGDTRIVTASATISGVTATVRAVCSISAGTCTYRRQ